MIRLVILGATGSIGRQALDVAERMRDRVQVVGLAAGSSADTLRALASNTGARWVALEAGDGAAVARWRSERPGPGVFTGPGAAAAMVRACDADVVLNGIVGAAGLEASLAALERGMRLALANKETLVVGGPLVRAALARGGSIVPVDSEHSAAMQCLGGRPADEVLRLTITASGGALRTHPDWRRATVQEVMRHPVWSMGPRITTDSATLFNKGLELIEAHHLFGLAWDQLDAAVHPETLIHAMVTFHDGSSVLQAAAPDMRLPIQLALSWPERWGAVVAPLVASQLAGLTFAPIERGRFPAFDLACDAGRIGGTAPCVANAADEIAVQAFIDGAIALGDVPEAIARVLGAHTPAPVESLEQLRAVDAWAREAARDAVVRT